MYKIIKKKFLGDVLFLGGIHQMVQRHQYPTLDDSKKLCQTRKLWALKSSTAFGEIHLERLSSTFSKVVWFWSTHTQTARRDCLIHNMFPVWTIWV